MHLRILVCALAVSLGLFPPTVSAFDFTPRLLERRGGFPTRYVPYFLNEGKRYTSLLPNDATLSGDSTAATYFFPKMEGATLKLMNSPLSPDLPFQDAIIPKYQEVALKTVPRLAENISVAPHMLTQGRSRDQRDLNFSVTYVLGGKSMVQQVRFINFTPKNQFLIVAISTENVSARALPILQSVASSFRFSSDKEDLAAEEYY